MSQAHVRTREYRSANNDSYQSTGTSCICLRTRPGRVFSRRPARSCRWPGWASEFGMPVTIPIAGPDLPRRGDTCICCMTRASIARCKQAVHWVADDRTDASARLVLQAGVALLRPDQQLFEAMLEGWRRQQLSRNLAFGTIERRLQLVSRFQAFTNDYPWCWTPVDLEEWIQELRGPRARARRRRRHRPQLLWATTRDSRASREPGRHGHRSSADTPGDHRGHHDVAGLRCCSLGRRRSCQRATHPLRRCGIVARAGSGREVQSQRGVKLRSD